MKVISPGFHGVLDYFTVLFLAISPSIFAMGAAAIIFTYVLAAIHLGLTVLTNFDLGIVRVIPLKIQGAIELVVSILLLIVAVLFRKTGDQTSYYIYLIFAIVLFIVWLVSDYRIEKRLQINES